MVHSWGGMFVIGMLLGLLLQPAGAQEQQTLAEKAKAAVEAARRANEAADAAAKAAKEAKEAADAAMAAAAAATEAAAAGGKPVVQPPPASEPAPAGQPAGKSPGAELSTYLTANSEGGNATIKVAHRMPSLFGDLIYSASLSSPLSKDAGFAEPATLDGLANGANVTLTLGKYFLTNPLSEDTGVWNIGGLARVGYSTFKYLDPSSLAKKSGDRTPTTIGGYAGFRPPGETPIFLLAKYEYQHAWKDADSKVLCPQSTTFPVACVNGPIGSPVENRKRLLSLPARYTNPLFDVAPTLTYDRVTRVKGVDFPVYLIKGGADEKNTLPFNAGVRIGWRSDTKDTSFGVFVGTPFSLFTP